MEKFNLPVHEHPLYHVGANMVLGNLGVLWSCDGCCGEGHMDNGFKCSKCRYFYLHKKCGESTPEINHPSHPDHPLKLLAGPECSGKRCHLCGVKLEKLCYHCSLCDFTLDTGCAIKPPLPIIDQPKAHEHTLTLTSTDIDFTCHICGDNRKYGKFFYLCTPCDLFFHIECAFLSPEINHPCHPRHLLKFLKGGSSVNPSKCSCTLCGVDIGDKNYYHCAICNFTVDLRCVKNPPPLALVSPKTHKHELALFPRLMSFTCNACGKQGHQSPYTCSQCNFMVHVFCIDLPGVIWINHHDHRISHTYDLDLKNLAMECGVCRQTVDPSYGAYSCLECKNYVVHSRCATKHHIWDGRDLEGEPHETEDVAPFKVTGYNLIKHFSHEEHDMKLIEDGSEDVACRACIKPIGADFFYKCMLCDYFLHETCANHPRKIRSLLSTVKMILVGGASYYQDIFFCGACSRYSSGFRYKNASFQDDLQCILTYEPVKREAHAHPLYFFSEHSRDCSCCGLEAKVGFECLKGDCAFALHINCAILPESVKHKADDHALRLCHGEYGTGKYWCDICEKEVDFFKQYYTCDECGTTFHIKCVLGDLFRNISLGSKLTLTDADGDIELEVVLNTGINRPVCFICHSRCTFSLVLKYLDRYICSYHCFSVVKKSYPPTNFSFIDFVSSFFFIN